MIRPVRVELLHHEGCPLAPAARRVVDECIQQLDIDADVTDRVARYPSPTVLVNGVDVMGDPAITTEVDACRLDVPTRDRVTAALRAAASSST
jgi:hypothetical protein